MTDAPSPLALLAELAERLASLARELVEADELTAAAGGLKKGGFPEHAERAGNLAAGKRKAAGKALAVMANRR